MERVIRIANNFELEASFNGDLISIYHEGWITTTTMVVGIGELSLCTPCESHVKYEGSTIDETLYVHSHFNLEVGDSVVVMFNDNNQSDVYVRLTNKAGKLRWKVLGQEWFTLPDRFQGEWGGREVSEEEFNALLDDELYPQSCKECFDFLQQCKKFNMPAPEWMERKSSRFEKAGVRFLDSIRDKDFATATSAFTTLEGMIPNKDATWLRFKTMLEGINPSDWIQE
jgi:hypothetical protein